MPATATELSRSSGLSLMVRRGVAALVLAALTLAGCTTTPRGIAEQYLTDLQQFNYGACYELLSDQDRHDRTLKEFLGEIPMAPDVSPDWFRPVLHVTHFDLGQQRRTADRAWVPVTVTTVDLPLWERQFDAAAGRDGSGSDTAQRSLETGTYPKRTVTSRMVLVKEHHHWHIYANFAARGRARDLHREAIVQYHEHDYDKAIATYTGLLAGLDQDDATGVIGLKTQYAAELKAIENVKSQMPAGGAYAAELKLSDVAMKMSEQRVPAIFGRIANDGQKAVDEVQLTVTWYERKGKNLHAAFSEKHPVVVTPFEFTSFAEPVLPFVPGEKRDFGFIIEAPVAVQQDAAPYVTVSSVAFTQSRAPLPKLANSSTGGEAQAAKPGAVPLPNSATPKKAIPAKSAAPASGPVGNGPVASASGANPLPGMAVAKPPTAEHGQP
ncbi:MAG: hypothetical protein ACREQN_00655 [Candidatus Binataceae bacterium]